MSDGLKQVLECRKIYDDETLEEGEVCFRTSFYLTLGVLTRFTGNSKLNDLTLVLQVI